MTSLQGFAQFHAKFRIDPDSGCWLWTGAISRYGYAIFTTYPTKITHRAHRLSYQWRHGAIPDGLVLDHFACDTPRCCNPDHVRPVTVRENILRSNHVSAWNLAKTHCLNGHLFDEVNTYRTKQGGRMCRICARDSMRRTRTRAKATT